MIELTRLWKKYRTSPFSLYVHELTFHDGEIVGILGANGSGKTSLLKAIVGLGELAGGYVRIDGKPPAERYDQIAFITEEGSYRREMTPLEYGSFLADYFPRFDMTTYKRMLDNYDLLPNEKIRTMSRGQKSKLEIAAGLAKRAKYIVMDEPFLGKDPFSRRDTLKTLVSELEGDEVILLSTHYIDEIEHIIDRAIILLEGTVKDDIYMDDLRTEGKTLTEATEQWIKAKWWKEKLAEFSDRT